MQKKISVVTGGAGFLGSHLTDRLLAEGSGRAAELGAPVLKQAYNAVGLSR